MGNLNIEALEASLKLGNTAAGNYLEIETDGTIARKGNSTVFEDMATSLIGRQLSSTAGKVDYDYDENAIVMQPSGNIATANDRVVWSYQVPHKAQIDDYIYLHMHYEQTKSDALEITIQYRIQAQGQAKTTAWQTVVIDTSVGNVFTYVSGTLNQIVSLYNIPITGFGISDIIQFRMARTDAVSGNILATFTDGHYKADTDGSRTEYTK